jgi:N-acylneuraminate cytidylyltransferase
MSLRVLALVPARSGSKGLPRKALRPLAGLPLIGHTLELARRSPGLARVIVSTDSVEIADVARSFGAEVPFMRPAKLATDATPMWPVVRHALAAIDANDSLDAVILLQPTSPLRLPEDVAAAIALLKARPDVDGVVGVSAPAHNPVWSAMTVQDGVLVPLVPNAFAYARRQELPQVVVVDGTLFLWRVGLVRAHETDPSANVRYAPVELPQIRSLDIDTEDDLILADVLLRTKIVTLPWLD